MKRIIVPALLTVFFVNLANAQYINNKLNLFAGYRLNNTLGEKVTNETGFISPNFFPNITKSSGYAFKGLLRVKNHFNVGLGIQYNTFCSWKIEDYNYYNSSKLSTSTFSLIFGIHSPEKIQGILNKFSMDMQVTPLIGLVSFSSDSALFNVYTEENEEEITSFKSKTLLTGVDLSIGANIKVSKEVGIFARMGYQYGLVSSKYYNDKNLSNLYFEGGIFLRLMKNKRIYE